MLAIRRFPFGAGARLGAVVLFMISGFSGLLTAFLSQASSPDYRHLFWSLMPYFVVHLIAVGAYFRFVRHWTRWILFVISIIAIWGIVECALRVFAR